MELPEKLQKEDAKGKFKRTLGNKLWRLQTLYKIRDKERRLTKLRLNNIQKRMLADVVSQKPTRHFFLKYRQGGVSTFWLLYWLDDTIFTENTITGILADKKENLGYLFEIVRLAHAYMPDKYRPRLGDDSKSALSFPDINSKIMVSLSIKSTALHNLHISEWCYCDDDEIGRTMAACSPTANITGESTGNGIGNNGHEIYQEARQGEGSFKASFYPWFIQEEYGLPTNGMTVRLTPEETKLNNYMQREYGISLTPEKILFRRQKQKDLKGLFPQEYPETDEDAFLTTGNKFFNARKIMCLLNEAREYLRAHPPKIDEHGYWTMWDDVKPKHVYAAGADTSEGVNDYSILKIIDVTERKEVFLFRALCGVDYFYRICNEWCRYYKNALLAVERNNHGHAVILGLMENCRYPNMYTEEKNNRLNTHVHRKSNIGWTTDRVSKTTMLNDLKFALEGDSMEDEHNFQPEVTFFDNNLFSEALTVHEENGKIEAIEGKHDDDVMATAIAFQMYKNLRKNEERARHTDQGIITAGKRTFTAELSGRDII